MNPRAFPLFFGLGLASLFSGGCATTASLHIPASPPPAWTHSSPDPSYLRLPITLSLPKVGTLKRVISDWARDLSDIPEVLIPKNGKFRFPSIPKIVTFWEAAQKPIYIDKGIWLLLRPEWISTGFARPNPNNLLKVDLILEVKTFPTLIFGSKPNSPRKPLPPLHLYKSGPLGFQAVGDTFISFEEANKNLIDPKNGMVGRVIPGSGEYRLRILGIKLYGSKGTVVAQVRLKYNRPLNIDGKPVQLTVYFRGIPKYDAKAKAFYLRRLDFDVKTNDFLTGVAGWIFKSDILKELRRHARIPIGRKLAALKERMNVVLNRPVGKYNRLETRVDSFDFLDAYVDKAGIQARLSLKGKAELKLLGE